MTTPARIRQLVRRFHRDDGTVGAQLVIATPLLLLLLLTIVQFALWSHATHIAHAAADQGLAATRTYDGSIGSGRAATTRMLDELAKGPLTNTSVEVNRGTINASVSVGGTVTQIIPIFRFPVHATVSGDIERFTPGG